MKPGIKISLYSIGCALIFLLVASVVLAIVFSSKSDNNTHNTYCDSETDGSCCEEMPCDNLMICEPEVFNRCPSQPCPPPCPPPQCQPCPPKPATFTYCQSISSTSIPCGNPTYGMTFDAASDVLAVSQQDVTSGTSMIFIYRLSSESEKPFYLATSDITVQGLEPLVAVYGSKIAIATTIGTKGMLYEYTFSDNQWILLATANLNLPPTWISLFSVVVALIVDKVVYYYNNGTIDGTSGPINAVSVAIDGTTDTLYSLIGTYGASYLYCKAGIDSGVGFGAPVRTFKQNPTLVPNPDFGKFVDLKIPLMAFSDGVSINVYNTNAIDRVATCIIPPGMTEPRFSIYGSNVLVYQDDQVQMYTAVPQVNCNSYDRPWYKSYSASFPGSQWIVAHSGAVDCNLLITHGNEVQSQLDSYKQIS